MMIAIPMETLLALIALEASDAETALGDDRCGADIGAAHLCGRVSGLLDILARIKNLEDPARLWAANLVAAEHKDRVREVVRQAMEHHARMTALKENLKAVFEDDDHRHMN